MIEAYSFGRIVVRGRAYSDDIKIIHGRVVPSWWRENGHLVEIRDVSDILEASPDRLVLGTGSSGLLRVAPELLALLREKGIEFSAVPTAKAVELFNRLAARGESVAAGFHLTC